MRKKHLNPPAQPCYSFSRLPLLRSAARHQRGSKKGPLEATKDRLKNVDRNVSDAAASGIETGECSRPEIQVDKKRVRQMAR